MARQRTVKSTPKRGTLTRREVRRVVRQVVQERRAEEARISTPQTDTTVPKPKSLSKTAQKRGLRR